MGRIQNSLSFIAASLIVLAPVLSIETPRILAFLPALICIFLLCTFKQEDWRKLKNIIVKYKRAIISLVIVLAYLWISNFIVAVYPEEAIERVTKLSVLIPLGVLFLAVIYIKKDSLYDIRTPLLMACSFGALLISFEIIADAPIYKFLRDVTPTDKFSTAVYNRGAVTIIMMTSALFLLDKVSKKQLLIALPIAAMLFLVQSQSAQLLFVVAILFYFIFPFAKKWAWKALFGLIAFGMLVKPFLVSKIYTILPDNIQDYPFLKQSYFGHRFEIWDYVSRQILEKPFFGHGLEFTKMFKGFQSQIRFGSDAEVLHPHSFILQIWIEQGVVGVLIAIAIIGSFMRFLYINPSDSLQKSALTLFIMSLTILTFSHGMWQSWWLGLVFLLAGLHLIHRDKKAI